MPPKRILFLAEGATMAHFVRPLVLADALDPRQYEVHFYAPARFSFYMQGKPYEVGELPTMPGERFLSNIGRGAPLFPPDVVRSYIAQDRRLIDAIRPDLVVGDMRPSLPISTHLEGTRSAAIMNAYWSPYARRRSIMPATPLTNVVPPRLLTPLFRLAEPMVHALHVGQMNRVRREVGMAALRRDLRVMYTDATYVLYPDIPEFVPTSDLPQNHRYVGICNWQPPVPRPEWWQRMLDDPKPKVFVELGSSGQVRILPTLLEALAKLPVSTLLSTSGRELPAAAAPAYTAGLLPLTETARNVSVVVSHGGSGGLYPAMAAGTAVLGIPSNADQHLGTALLEESGAGIGVRVEEASGKRLLRALEKLLFDPQYRAAAQRWAGIYSRYDTAMLFRDFLSSI